jgi:hypothetical protein
MLVDMDSENPRGLRCNACLKSDREKSVENGSGGMAAVRFGAVEMTDYRRGKSIDSLAWSAVGFGIRRPREDD